jgi:hypothetical protein
MALADYHSSMLLYLFKKGVFYSPLIEVFTTQLRNKQGDVML